MDTGFQFGENDGFSRYLVTIGHTIIKSRLKLMFTFGFWVYFFAHIKTITNEMNFFVCLTLPVN